MIITSLDSPTPPRIPLESHQKDWIEILILIFNRHIDCFENDYAGFHTSYGVYSLGLVLFEVAECRPVKETFSRSARAKALTARKNTK
jgi:hypothetical protein